MVDGELTSTGNMTSLTIRLDESCDTPQFKCLASNNEGARERVVKSKLHKKCGFFEKCLFINAFQTL